MPGPPPRQRSDHSARLSRPPRIAVPSGTACPPDAPHEPGPEPPQRAAHHHRPAARRLPRHRRPPRPANPRHGLARRLRHLLPPRLLRVPLLHPCPPRPHVRPPARRGRHGRLHERPLGPARHPGRRTPRRRLRNPHGRQAASPSQAPALRLRRPRTRRLHPRRRQRIPRLAPRRVPPGPLGHGPRRHPQRLDRPPQSPPRGARLTPFGASPAPSSTSKSATPPAPSSSTSRSSTRIHR